MVAPAPADERGPERPRRVHRRAVERATGEDVRAQDEADGVGDLAVPNMCLAQLFIYRDRVQGK